MRTFIRRFALFLPAGFMINLLAAWGLGRFVDTVRWAMNHDEDSVIAQDYCVDHHWYVDTISAPGTSILNSSLTVFPPARREEMRSLGVDEPRRTNPGPEEIVPRWTGVARLREVAHLHEEGFYEERRVDARGWPMLSFYCWYEMNSTGNALATHGTFFEGGSTWQFGPYTGPRSMPYLPIWSGMIVNSLLYALILMTPFAIVRTFRRSIRRRRGLCAACAYPCGESAVCTECGKKLPISQASQVG